MTEVEKMMRDIEFEIIEKQNVIDDLNEEIKALKIEENKKYPEFPKEETIWGFQLVNSSVHYTKNPIYDNERLVYIDEVELVDNDWIFKRLLKVNTKHIMLTWKVK